MRRRIFSTVSSVTPLYSLPSSAMMGSVITSRPSFFWLAIKSRMMPTWAAEARKPVVMQSKRKPSSFHTAMALTI